MNFVKSSWAVFIVFILYFTLVASVSLPKVIDDNMVLQQGKEVAIWGTASSGASITVEFNGQTESAAANNSGEWKVILSPMGANSTSQEMQISGDGSNITLNNILIGEVWFGSGQSNMEAGFEEAKTTQAIYDNLMFKAPYNQVRLLCDGADLHKPAEDCSWEVANSSSIPGFSSLLFQFGLEISEKLGVPVGLIEAAMGAKSAAYFITSEMIEGYNVYMHQEWERDSQTGGPMPPQPVELSTNVNQLGSGYNSMVRGKTEGFGIRGIYWDQGESGPGVGRMMFPAMGALIYGWQMTFEQNDLWFIYNQKPNGSGATFFPPTGDQWPLSFGKTVQDLPPELYIDSLIDTCISGYWFYSGHQRHDYTMIEKFPRTLMAVSSDFSAGSHPKNKRGNAMRAARGALGYVYGRTDLYTDYTGPTYDGYSIEGSSVRIFFKHAKSGLAAGQISTIQGFLIRGQDSVWHWADAQIENDTQVVVSHSDVSNPIEVRYGYFKDIPMCNLFNNDSIPAITFRTGQEHLYYVPGQESLPVYTHSVETQGVQSQISIGARWIVLPSVNEESELHFTTLSGRIIVKKFLNDTIQKIDRRSLQIPSGCYLISIGKRNTPVKLFHF